MLAYFYKMCVRVRVCTLYSLVDVNVILIIYVHVHLHYSGFPHSSQLKLNN